jgi:hypothetical protein
MMGVVKLLDPDGRVRDVALYFGRGGLSFGEGGYVLRRAVFVGPDGVERPVDITWRGYPGGNVWGVTLGQSDRVSIDAFQIGPG